MTYPPTPDPRNDEITPCTELSGAEEDSGWEDVNCDKEPATSATN